MFFSDSVEIKAPPAVVWKSLKDERQYYNSKVDNVIGDTYHLHQEYPTPIGLAKCSFLIVDQPFKKMDFLLYSSPDIKSLKGDWTLISTEPNKTILTLHIDYLKIKVLAPEFLVKKVMAIVVKSRLKRIESRAEEGQTYN